jgi:hypothetical protein
VALAFQVAWVEMAVMEVGLLPQVQEGWVVLEVAPVGEMVAMALATRLLRAVAAVAEAGLVLS